MASFQVQAATGRGQRRERSAGVTPDAVAERVRRATGLPQLAWDTALVGHPQCNRATMLATVGGRPIDVLTDGGLYDKFLHEFRHVPFGRHDVVLSARKVLAAALRRPYWLLRGGAFLARKLWQARAGLAGGGRIGKITFFIHNFMDVGALDPERIRNCSFMVMTEEGPVSMCAVNARRDDFILSRPPVPGDSPGAFWSPRTGRIERWVNQLPVLRV